MDVLAVSYLAATCFTLIPQSSQSCTSGSPRECREAEWAPGSSLAGEGFDIVKMQRKGVFVIDHNLQDSGSCMLCRNPYQEGKFQRVPLSVVDWIARQKCIKNVASALHKSSGSLVNSITSSVENNWKADLGLAKVGDGMLILAGAQSKLAEYSMEKSKKDTFSFLSHKMVCTCYRYRLSNQSPLHPEFQYAISQLPDRYTPENKQHFYKVINTFGTHFLTGVTLGGLVHSVTSIRTCRASLQRLRVHDIKMCLHAEVTASVRLRADAGAEKYCQQLRYQSEDKRSSVSSRFNDRLTEIFGGNTTESELLFSDDPLILKDWLSSLPGNPDVVSYALDPLHKLVPPSLPVQKELGKAIRHYILERGLWQDCSGPCMHGSKRNPQDPCVCSCHGDFGVDSDCCPTIPGLARVIITAVRATGLWGDGTTSTDAYVKVLNPQNIQLARTPVIWNNNSPWWNMAFDISEIDLSVIRMVKFEVWDEDSKWDDDLLGTCTVDLRQGTTENVCHLNHGLFFYKLQVICGPSLGGPFCSEYISSPKGGVSVRPIPEDMLMKMGLVEDEDPPHSNEKDEYMETTSVKSSAPTAEIKSSTLQSFCLR